MKIELSSSDALLALPPAELLDHVRRWEAMGFDGVALPDLMRYGLDLYSFYVAALMSTDRVSVFPCVGNPITRHPWVLASVALTLDRLAPGRFRLLLGSGTWLNLGRRPARLAEMREAVTTIRALLAGEPVTLTTSGQNGDTGASTGGGAQAQAADHFDQLHRDGLIAAGGTPPPVCIAAGGPRMTELAGEVADEVMTLGGHDPRTVAAIRGLLARGAERSGRCADEVKIAHWAWVLIDEDEDAAYARMREMLLQYPIGSHVNQTALDALGLDWPLDRLADVPADEWRSYIDAVAFAGPAEKIAARIQELARDGRLDRLIVGMAPGDDTMLDAFARTVIPSVR